MEFNLINNMIVNELQHSIASDNVEIRTTIFNGMYSWYIKNYADKIRQACLSNNKMKLKYYVTQIENICNLSDVDKLKITFNDPKYTELISISDEIFNRIKENKMLNEDEYNNYVNRIEEIKSKINKIYKRDSEHIVSECMLDLEYLKRNGNFEYYSLRFNQYRSTKRQ